MAGKAGKSGGNRAGSGRKPKRDKYSALIEKAENSIRDRLPFLVDKLFTLANGVMVQETDAEGTVDAYAEPPNLKALVYLMDRALGKPPQAIKVSGDAGKPPIRVSFFLPMNGRDPAPKEPTPCDA